MLFQNILEQSNEILNTLYWVLGIGVAWIVLRLIFKIAKKVFAIGCFGIIFLGLGYMLLSWMQVI
ncbi:MAG: hypothetical protein ABFS17_04135 [Chloroflexota bacterium]